MQRTPRCVKVFDEVERVGTEISCRCVGCRNCQECKRSSRIDSVSIQEEIEQDLINSCVQVDIENRKTTTLLPFITNPDNKLSPTENFALKIYESQIRGLEKKPNDKVTILESEGKLQKLGFVDYLDNLPNEDKDAILSSKVKYFIPWRVVFNESSVSTPCRLVLDASCCPRTGCSLNSLLAKGTNNMNKLTVILIAWCLNLCAFHTDIAKMYNAIILHKKHWRYQLYFWDDELRVGIAPRVKVIKTNIYGVRSSGNIAECGIRKTAEITRLEFPKAYDVIMNDTYVDDILSGDNSLVKNLEKTDQLNIALGKIGFILEGFTFSGSDPPEYLSNDGVSVMVGGYRWFSKEDTLSINVPELNLAKKRRGRKSLSGKGKMPEKLTKRDCVSRVAEIFDPIGRVTPLTSGFKIDINELTLRNLSWDDAISENLRQIWADNFEMINEIRNIRFKRAVIPEDAIDINVETIDTADASQKMICVAIHARFRKKSGGFSCQLIFARSKVVPRDMSTPRAELFACVLNATTGHVVTTGKCSGGTINCRAGLVVDLPKNMINAALKYYFVKATEEIKHFVPESKIRNISEEKDGVLYYTGRILPTQRIGGDLTLCDTSFDLTKATFCVRLIDISSPIVYVIACEVHWYHPNVKHGGIESVLRQVQRVAHIINGRTLIIAIKKSCSIDYWKKGRLK